MFRAPSFFPKPMDSTKQSREVTNEAIAPSSQTLQTAIVPLHIHLNQKVIAFYKQEKRSLRYRFAERVFRLYEQGATLIAAGNVIDGG